MQSILIIDDDDRLRDTLNILFEQEGFRVLQAADGRCGLEQALTQKPDLIVADLRLPGISGMGDLQADPRCAHEDAGHCSQRSGRRGG